MKQKSIILSVAAAAACAFMLFGCSSLQRKLLYFPTHSAASNGLTEWRDGEKVIGYAREVASPRNVWLMLHGNGGQASDRVFALPRFDSDDSAYVLEYPGYGGRAGTPSMPAINAAAHEAYVLLRLRFPDRPVCVVADSLGTGPACILSQQAPPPDKLVLIVPYDELARVAAEHYPSWLVRLLLTDNWNNLSALATYRGPIEIFAADNDRIIPISHAKALAASKPQTVFHVLRGGHNDWPQNASVKFRNP